MSTTSNVLHFIEGNSGAALLIWHRERWYLKGISQECLNATCEGQRVTLINEFHDWLQPYTQIDFTAALHRLPPIEAAAAASRNLLGLGLVLAIFALLLIVYCCIRQSRLKTALSELPLAPQDPVNIVLTDKKTWRFSHIEQGDNFR